MHHKQEHSTQVQAMRHRNCHQQEKQMADCRRSYHQLEHSVQELVQAKRQVDKEPQQALWMAKEPELDELEQEQVQLAIEQE